MEIKFQTKEESNSEQRSAFLRLSKSERFMQFLHLTELSSRFPTQYKKESKAFKIVIESPENGK